MRERKRTPVVPLEAGAGPDNPPCPICGEPLFGWIGAGRELDGLARRCESCGLGVIGVPGDLEEALRALDRLGASRGAPVANRGGFSAWLGRAGWSGLEPGARYLFTIEAVRRLVAHRDELVVSARWSPGAGIAAMWQTMLNSFTFGHNVALGALGRGASEPAVPAWQRWLDGLISVLVAIPAMLVAVVLEAGAAAFRRGGAYSLRFELL